MAEDTPQAQNPVSAPTPAMPTGQPEKGTEQKPTQQNDSLPNDTSERTKAQFEKMEFNYRQQLQEERNRREQIESAFKTLSQPKTSAPPPIVDPVTGLIDERALTDLQKRSQDADARAAKAEKMAADLTRKREEDLAYAAHPWMNPKDKKVFNQDRYNLATGIALASMVDPEKFGGKTLDLQGAGDYVARLTKAEVEQVKEATKQETIEQLSPKEQAALEATGSPNRASEVEDNSEDLRIATRRGGSQSINAIAERMKRLKQA